MLVVKVKKSYGSPMTKRQESRYKDSERSPRVTLRYSLAGWERSGEILFPACDLGLLEGDWLRCQGFECALAGASALAPAPAWPQSEHREPLTLDGPFVQSSQPEQFGASVTRTN